MIDFILGIFTFPTAFYTGLLALVLLYWLTAIFGLSSFDTSDGDMALDTDMEVGDNSYSVANVLSKFKLEGIPTTISLSFIILVSWVVSFVAVHFLFPMIPEDWIQVTIGFWILVIAPILSAAIVSPFLQPLKPIFKKRPDKRSQDSVGQYALVRSGKVTATVGEATLQDGGAGLILKIRCLEANKIARGDLVKLYRYDPTTGTYLVRVG